MSRFLRNDELSKELDSWTEVSSMTCIACAMMSLLTDDGPSLRCCDNGGAEVD